MANSETSVISVRVLLVADQITKRARELQDAGLSMFDAYQQARHELVDGRWPDEGSEGDGASNSTG